MTEIPHLPAWQFLYVRSLSVPASVSCSYIFRSKFGSLTGFLFTADNDASFARVGDCYRAVITLDNDNGVALFRYAVRRG